MPRSFLVIKPNWIMAVLATAVFLLSACESSLDVRADVEEDGSGVITATVELDQEATAAILDLDTVGLALSDLDTAGWETEPPLRLPSGGLQLSASKAFGNPEQFSDLLEEITGDADLFKGFVLSRVKEFARVDFSVTGAISPDGLEVFGDQALTDSLERSIESLAARYGASAEDANVELRIALPGEVRESETATGAIPTDESGTVRIWSANLADSEPTLVVFASATRTVAALVWRGVAILAAVLAGLVLLGQVLRVVRPQNRRGRSGKRTNKKGKAPVAPKPKPAPVIPAEEAVIAEGEVRTAPTVVALDGMGVIYREGNDINQILIPFAREKGSEVTEDEIAARSRSFSLGRMTPAEFWASIGIEGDSNELDEEYLSRHQLNPGVIKFLRALRDQGVRVACVTNDATTWANKLRVRHSLEGLIDPWVISGAVGVRKPDRPIYEVLRRVTEQPPGLIMVVDDELRNLDAAREMGFRTAWFNPDASAADANGHAILRSLDVQAPDTTPAPGA